MNVLLLLTCFRFHPTFASLSVFCTSSCFYASVAFFLVAFFFSLCDMSSLFWALVPLAGAADLILCASQPFSINFFMPPHTLVWVMIRCACGFIILIVVDCWPSRNMYLAFLLVDLGYRSYLLLLYMSDVLCL